MYILYSILFSIIDVQCVINNYVIFLLTEKIYLLIHHFYKIINYNIIIVI